MTDKFRLSSLSEYLTAVAETDMLAQSDIGPILQGLYGEVGGIMATAKKHIREQSAFPGFQRAAEEEFGDTLWYLAALCRRLKLPLDQLFTQATNEVDADLQDAAKLSKQFFAPNSVDETLFGLGRSAAALLSAKPAAVDIAAFVRQYIAALRAAGLPLIDVFNGNAAKTRGVFITPKLENLIDFDAGFPTEEQLPQTFRVRVNQRPGGKSYLQWNGVFIGDPLTDNIADPDGYRFHDVFHFSYAAILHWSPVIRALIKQKRKSRPEYDEAEDGGRAIVVEEGLTAWIFTHAKTLNFFEGQKRISLGVLKTISEFVTGYEVAQCPLKLWERAVLDGYEVFRQVRSANGGWVIGDRVNRTIRYAPLEMTK